MHHGAATTDPAIRTPAIAPVGSRRRASVARRRHSRGTIGRPSHPVLVAAAFVLAVTSGVVGACLWDRDTLREETEGRIDVHDVILGRYDVFPPRYYAMRLERVTAELGADPTRLDLYDDAAVACDRLRDFDAGIAWMAKKRTALDTHTYDERTRFDHEYRYLANLGTLHAHRWVVAGASRDDITDLVRGRDLIAEAIRFNPAAHFGREKYQLAALEWLVRIARDPTAPDRPESDRDREQRAAAGLPPSQRAYWSELEFSEIHSARYVAAQPLGMLPEALRQPDAVEGLVGLIRLGGGRESVDLYAALVGALHYRGDASISVLAQERGRELLAKGRRSIDPLLAGLGEAEHWRALFLIARDRLRPEYAAKVSAYYARARAEAESWRMARLAYLERMLDRRQHPDTHPRIWARAPHGARPRMPEGNPGNASPIAFGLYASDWPLIAGIAVALAAFTAGWSWWRDRRRHHPGRLGTW